MVARWICAKPIDGLVDAQVLFRREPQGDELIVLDELSLNAGPEDYRDGAYYIRGTAHRRLKAGTYRSVGARIEVRAHPVPVRLDLTRYADEFAIVLFDDSLLAVR